MSHIASNNLHVLDLKDYARSIGLAGLAVGPAEPLDTAARRLEERVQKGFAGHYGLVEGSQEKLCHPERLLPGARTIIACALPYLRPVAEPPRDTGELTGRTARFARGRDYHVAIGEKMKLVEEKLKEMFPEAGTRLLHDTGPLMDRAAAQRAGLGWYGRNACFFVEGFGSWVVLGEIVTDVDLPHDEPFEGHKCGSCELCLAACPTGAIEAPFQINMNRCISHLTQMSGFIPRELRPLMGRMIYGCDICQEVCPQNEGVAAGDPADFEPGGLPAAPELVQILEMDRREFDEKLKHTSAGWIGRNRLRRNACVALGNIKEPAGLRPLMKAINDAAPVVRAHAAWALGQLGAPEGLELLRKRLRTEPDPEVRAEIQHALK